MTPTATISPSALGHQELIIEGLLPHPLWVGFLFTGLAQWQISVISGKAVQTDVQHWQSRFTLDFSCSRATPQNLDYIMMAQRRSSSIDVQNPKLNRYEVFRRPDLALEVRLEGPDQIGFLSRLLGRFSLLMLFPAEIEINTVAGVIRDRVVFKGLGGTVLDDNARTALDTLLRGFVTA
jgi:hypothetical protein